MKKITFTRKKSTWKFHEVKNKDATSFTNKNISTQQKNRSWTNTNHQAAMSMNRINFTRRNSRFKFHEEKNQDKTSFLNKENSTPEAAQTLISTQQVPWTKSVSREGKSMYKFHEERNQNVISFLNKIRTQQVPRTKDQQSTSSMNKIMLKVKVGCVKRVFKRWGGGVEIYDPVTETRHFKWDISENNS